MSLQLNIPAEASPAVALETQNSLISRSLEPSNPDFLQFASLLSGAFPAGQSGHVVMFTAASPGIGVGRFALETARALRHVRSCRTAVVALHAAKLRNAPVNGSSPFAARGWDMEDKSGLTVATWAASGADNSTVSSPAIEDLLGHMRPHLDFILVDAGALLLTQEALVAAPYCAACVLLVRSGVTTSEEVRRSEMLLSRANVRVLGFTFVENG